jgi:hypothetical protein
MTDNLPQILGREVERQSSAKTVALSLSGGLDSTIMGLICEKVGKRVVAYTYELDGIPSSERPIAEAIARHMGWSLRIVRVPTAGLSSAFLRLAIEHRCTKKTQFEVTYPIAHVRRFRKPKSSLAGILTITTATPGKTSWRCRGSSGRASRPRSSRRISTRRETSNMPSPTPKIHRTLFGSPAGSQRRSGNA